MINKIVFNPHWLITTHLISYDYKDAYRIEVDTKIKIKLGHLPVLFFQSIPKWVGALFKLREAIVEKIGLKTATNIDMLKQLENFKGNVGDSIGLFNVIAKNNHELLTGENDRHLDFRLSFIVEKNNDKQFLILATTVKFNNWMGRLYFIPVKPFHKLIVRTLLKRMKNNILKNQN